jgi:hypothetical protein
MRPTANKIELEKRIRQVQEWILMDNAVHDILTQCIQSWNVSKRQAERYVWAARQFFIEKTQESFEKKRAYYLARKRKLIRDMDPKEKKTAAGVAAVNRVLDSMQKLEGVSTDTLKLIGDPEKPLITETKVAYSSEFIDYSTLPTEFLKFLLASRRKAS